MPRESTILVYRSDQTRNPTGLTFGELAYSDVGGTGQLFIGTTAGNSLWIGGGITTGNISTNSAWLIPTQSAVKNYVDGIVVGGSVVNSVNGLSGSITLTGDGSAIRKSVDGSTEIITARNASTSLTGVASFSTNDFVVGTTGHVGLTSTIARTNVRNNFTAYQDFAVGLSASGITSYGDIVIVAGAGNQPRSIVGKGGLQLIGTTAGSITQIVNQINLYGGSINPGIDLYSGDGTVRINPSGAPAPGIPLSSKLEFLTYDSGENPVIVSIQASGDYIQGDRVIELPNSSGIMALHNQVVRTFAGFTADGVQVTGDSGAVRVRTNVQEFSSGNRVTTTVTARLADTGVTGVASFTGDVFIVESNGGISTGRVGLKDGGVANKFLANPFIKFKDSVGQLSDISLGGTLTITGGTGIYTTSYGLTGFGIAAVVASNTVLGVASFDSSNFWVSATGHVTLTGSAVGASGDTVSAGDGIRIERNANQVTVFNLGVTAVNGLTGFITITGDGSAVRGVGNNIISIREASTSVTGVASFNSSHFTVTNGQVSLLSGFTITGDTVSATAAGILAIRNGSSVSLFNTGVTAVNGLAGFITITGDGSAVRGVGNNAFTIREATTSVTGVASFNSNHFAVSNGQVSLLSGTGDTVSATAAGILAIRNGSSVSLFNTGVTAVNGLTGFITITGDGSAVRGAANNIITARNASTSLTGVASFNSASFDVSEGGDVTIKNAGVSNTQLANSSITIKAGSNDGGQPIALGGNFSITGTANQINITRSTSEYTVALTNNVIIPGDLTVNGTVITANVDNFVVEDPLFMLGTGNASDTVDIGFYGLYAPASGRAFTGLFRDATDGKYRLFTNLTGSAEPTTTVNTSGQGYTVATLIARVDGGTF